MECRGRASLTLAWTVTAALVLVSLASVPARGQSFSDTADNGHEHNIEQIVRRGIAAGCATDPPRYCPRRAVTRGQMATFLARVRNLPAASADHFIDDNGTLHEDSINRVVEAGIADGVGRRRYAPNRDVTRAQMATFLVKSFGLPQASGDHFRDDEASPHEDSINRAAEAGLALGCHVDPPQYCADASVRRDQMATFLVNAMDLGTFGSIAASPNPARVLDGSGRGEVTLTWTSTGTQTVEVRVNSPSGYLVARSGPDNDSVTTGRWVVDGTTFYLQDVSHGRPLTRDHTLATVSVDVVADSGLAPAIGLNKFELMLQYLGRASEGDGTAPYRTVTRAMAKKAIADARDLGVSYMRVSVMGTDPAAYGRAGDLDLWRSDPAAHWAAVDEMMSDLEAAGVRIIPVFVWSWAQLPAMTGDTTADLITSPTSPSYRLLAQYVSEFVRRYRDHPTLYFYELTNELNLKADLDQRARALNDTDRPPEMAEPIRNISTDEMIGFTRRLAALIRTMDAEHLISSGHSIPRKSAEHLRRQPEFSSQGPDWTRDSRADFEKNLADLHQDVDIVSVHFYNDGDHERFGIAGRNNVALLDIIDQTVDRLGKRLFLGEIASTDPPLRDDKTAAFMQNVMDKIVELRIPHSAPWAWQFYQNATHVTYDTRLTANNMEPGYTDLILSRLQDANRALGNVVPTRPTTDTSPPRVVVTWPLARAHVTQPRKVHAVASDDGRAATRVDFLIDNAVVASDTTAPYEFTFDPATTTTGDHVLVARAYDRAGNSGDYTVNISSARPVSQRAAGAQAPVVGAVAVVVLAGLQRRRRTWGPRGV